MGNLFILHIVLCLFILVQRQLHLKKLGVRRVKSLSNGVLFTGDAVTEILACLQAKQAKNDTIPFELNISALPILAWFRSPLSFGTPTLEAQYS